ncbi:MFS transporter [Eggerthella sinensis]|uniref:MFS transporter n=1 Tax=Eggerthella sinensis TaxID=242230 RepID=A0A3N0IUB7_9ACTN|nr:MFS transporter [Eggerthella sinensis]RDB64284.1 MFS transporter [Eggerthella sinensis]RNM40594.1 MFS transporter [Eggerthella sinensis]
MKTLLNPSFVSVIFAQVASLFGDAVLRFALPLYVLNLTGSAALMGAVAAAAWIPYIVLTPIGGVAADRVNKRRIMAVLDTLLAVTCAAYLALDGVIDLIGLSICALIILYAAQSVYQPTVQAAVPFIVPRDGIVRATAIVSQISALSGLVGPVLGGLLFGLFGIEPVVLVSGVAFAASAVLIVVFVRIPRDAIERSNVGVVRTVVNDIAESFAFLRHDRPVILKLIFLVAGINVSLTAFILIGAPVIVTQILGLPNQYMGFAEGAMALGGLAGGISVGVFARRLKLDRAPLFLLVAAVALLPIAVILGVSMDAFVAYGVLLASLFVAMACATMFSIQSISFVQLETPGHLVGKVIALIMSLANCAQPVGQLIYGGLFDALRGNLVPVALGTALIAFVIGAITFRVLKRGLAELPADATGSVGDDDENASEDVTEERLPVNA